MSGKDLRYYGFIMEFLKEVSRVLNISYDVRFITPQKHGDRQGKEGWSGLIGDVSKGVGFMQRNVQVDQSSFSIIVIEFDEFNEFKIW